MQTNETVEVVRRFNQAFQDHDPEIFAELVGPDWSWRRFSRHPRAPATKATM